MNTRRNRIGSNQFKTKRKPHVGLHLLGFIVLMQVLTALYLFYLPKTNIISPYVQANEPVSTPVKTEQLIDTAKLEIETKEKLVEDVMSYIKTIFGREGKMAIEVQSHECNPLRKDFPRCEKNDEIEYSCGLWQINLRYHAPKVPGDTLREKCDNLKNDWKLSTLIAHKIYSDSKGFWPWTWFKKVGYLKYE